jgi:hypothetical protein
VDFLSEQRISTPATSSMAASLLTMASFLASSIAPTAMVTERTAGRAAGMAATTSTRANYKVCRRLSCLRVATMNTRVTRIMARMIR